MNKKIQFIKEKKNIKKKIKFKKSQINKYKFKFSL